MLGHPHASLLQTAEQAAIEAQELEHQRRAGRPQDQLLAELRGGCAVGWQCRSVLLGQKKAQAPCCSRLCESLACVTQYASC